MSPRRGPDPRGDIETCPECGHAFPDEATECPHCAVAAARARDEQRRRQRAADLIAELGLRPFTRSRHFAAIALDSALESLGIMTDLVGEDGTARQLRRALELVHQARRLIPRS